MNTGTKTISIAEEAFQKNLIYSKWLWRAAWSIEIVAAGIGLATGWVIAVGTKPFIEENIEAFPGGITANIILAGLPFFAIAIVELMKIPMAMGFYFSRRLVWKIVFLISLGALMIMTFETIMNGLERNYTQQKARTQTEVDEKTRLESSMNNLVVRLEDIKSESDAEIVATYLGAEDQAIEKRDGDLKELKTNYDSQIENITEQRKTINQQFGDSIKGTDSLKKTIEETQVSYKNAQDLALDEIATLEENLKEEIVSIQQNTQSSIQQQQVIVESRRSLLTKSFENRMKELDDAWPGQKDEINTRYDIQEKAWNDDIKAAETLITDLSKQQENKIQNARDDASGKVENKRIGIANTLEDYDNAIDDLRKKIDEREGFSEVQRNEALGILKEEEDKKTQSYEEDREEILNRYQSEIERAQLRRDNAIKVFTTKQNEITEIESKIQDYKDQITATENKINKATGGFQIRRVAAIIYRVEPGKVTEEQVGVIATFWLVSISLIVSLIGTVLAIASFVLADREVFTPKNVIKKPIRSSLRRMILSRRRFYQRNKETRFADFLGATNRSLSALRERLLRPKIKYFERPVEKIVTVTKEVPVDKVVYKEVPKEIIRKEMVYVPFYSMEGGTIDLTGKISDLKDPDEKKGTAKVESEKNKVKKQDPGKSKDKTKTESDKNKVKKQDPPKK